MEFTEIELFDDTTVLHAPEQLVKEIVTDVGMHRRQLALPREFNNELRAIQAELKPKQHTLTQKLINRLSMAGMISLEIALNFLAITNFGLGPVLAYYFSTPALATKLAIRRTLSQLSKSSSQEKAGNHNLSTSEQALSYPLLMINFAESLAGLLPLNTQSLNLDGRLSKDITGAKIALAFGEYQHSLSPECIDAAIPSTYMTPEKSGFSTESKNDYLATHVEVSIIRYVRDCMRRLARIIIDELPHEIIIHPQLSWLQTAVRQMQRLLQPLTIPYQLLTRRGHFNPVKRQLKTAKKVISESDQSAHDDEVRKSELLSTMIKHAQTMYKIETERQVITEREKVHQQTLSDQERIIKNQEAKIRILQCEINGHHLTLRSPV